MVINLISTCCKPNTWDAEVRANNTVILYVKYLSERSSFCPHSDLIKSITVWTFQIKQYLGFGGLLLKTPATKEQIWDVPPTGRSLECGHENQMLVTPIIIYSSILKPILKDLGQKF